MGVQSPVSLADIALMAERLHGKQEVEGSNPSVGSMDTIEMVIWEDPDSLGYFLVPADPEVPDEITVDEDGVIRTPPKH